MQRRVVRGPFLLPSGGFTTIIQQQLPTRRQSVLTQFVEETTHDIKVLYPLLPSGDTARVRDIVHRLSGRLSQVGISNLGSQFKEMESMLVAGKPVRELAGEIENILMLLEELIAQLRLTTMEHLN